MSGIYIHIPFCKSKCTYCDFASFPKEIGKTESYFACLYRETEGRGRALSGKTFDTVYFGGGTPSVVPAKFIAGELKQIRKFFDLADNAEITIELNPGTVDEDVMRALEEKKTYDTWQQGLLQIFEAVLDNKPFIMNVYRSVSREQVETYLYKLTYELLIGVVREKAAGMSVREEDMDFIATVYQYAFVGLMLDWIKNDMKGEPEVIVDRLAQVMHGNVTAALERLRIDKAPSNSPE